MCKTELLIWCWWQLVTWGINQMWHLQRTSNTPLNSPYEDCSHLASYCIIIFTSNIKQSFVLKSKVDRVGLESVKIRNCTAILMILLALSELEGFEVRALLVALQTQLGVGGWRPDRATSKQDFVLPKGAQPGEIIFLSSSSFQEYVNVICLIVCSQSFYLIWIEKQEWVEERTKS